MAIFKGENIGDTLKSRIGPAPVWVYGIILVLGVTWYMRRRKAASGGSSGGAQASSGLPTEVVQGGQMPYTQLGDTFVNVTVGGEDKDKHPKPPHHKPPKKGKTLQEWLDSLNKKKTYKVPGGVWEYESNKWELKENKKRSHSPQPRHVPKRHTKSSHRG